MAKNRIQQRRAGLAERARAGAGGAVIIGSNPVLDLWTFFFFHFRNFSKFFSGLLCRYSKR